MVVVVMVVVRAVIKNPWKYTYFCVSRVPIYFGLWQVEGFEKGSKNILICATNRKDDLDSALIRYTQSGVGVTSRTVV